jgi:hypothetical protein
MTRIVGNLRDLKGVDYAHANWEFKNKTPSHMFFIIYFDNENEYDDAIKHGVSAVERERQTNDIFLLEIDYSTGEIKQRVKTMDEIIHNREEPFHKFTSFFTKRRGFKNNSITINCSSKYRYVSFVLNHSFADGIKMYNDVMTNTLIGAYTETYTKHYVYTPFINELCMLKSIINNVKLSLSTKQSFSFTPLHI